MEAFELLFANESSISINTLMSSDSDKLEKQNIGYL